jgi:hypothetical protein
MKAKASKAKAKKVAIRDLKPRKATGVKGGGYTNRNTDFTEKFK